MSESKKEQSVKKHYQRVQKLLVSALLKDSSQLNDVLAIITHEDLADPVYSVILESMSEVARTDEIVSVETVAGHLRTSGTYAKVGDATLFELYADGDNALIMGSPVAYARVVRELSSKHRIQGILEDSGELFDADSGTDAASAIAQVQSDLSAERIRLSDDSSVIDIADHIGTYLDIIQKRRDTSEANKESAEGLQGIPTMVPSLNKYTAGLMPQQLITVGAKSGVGKALDVNTPMLTLESGWITMGELKPGYHHVPTVDGTYTKVVRATEHMSDRPCFRVSTSNEASLIADGEHQWEVIVGGKSSVLTTHEIIPLLESKKVYIAKPDPIDGGIPVSSAYEMGVDIARRGRQIDDSLLYESDVASRYELLAGITNTIGYVSLTGEVFLYAKDAKQHSDLKRLLSTLGMFGKTPPYSGLRDKHVLYFIPNRKYVDNPRLRPKVDYIEIESIVPVESRQVRCIEVAHESHMYLAGELLTPTHNSVFAIMQAVASARAGLSVLMVSLEMSEQEIVDRIVANISGVSLGRLKTGYLSADDIKKVEEASDELSKMKIQIDTDVRATVDSIRSRCIKEAESERGLDILIVDYLQLITPTGRFGSRQEQVADLSRNMKLLAKSLNIPVVVLSQLNRQKGTEDGETPIPTIDNIRESAALGQDSDIVILLHRENKVDNTTPHTTIILEKNRNGKSGIHIPCYSILECSMLREIVREKNIEEEPLSDDDIDSMDLDDDTSFDDDSDLDDFGDDDYDFDDDLL